MGYKTACSILLVLSLLPMASLAQTEPQPEVDVSCVNYYDRALENDPRYTYTPSVAVECNIQNDNVYQVEVETSLEWAYEDDYDSSSTLTINANSQETVYLYLTATEDALAGVEIMTMEATVIQYGGIRDCSGCETTSDSLEIELLEWTMVEVDLLSESPTGTFGLNELYEFQTCEGESEFYLRAQVTVDGNHDVDPAIGFDYEFYSYSIPKASEISVGIPEMVDLDIGVGQQTEIEATYTLDVKRNQSEDVYVIFFLVLGERDDVEDYLEDPYYYYDLDFYVGGCLLEGKGDGFDDDESPEPIIIEATSDNSNIYLLAGIGGATTVCLLIVLIVILLRKGD